MPTPEELDEWSRSYIPGQARCFGGVFSCHINAVSWFPQASDNEIVALLDAGFKGDPVKAIAYFLAAENPNRDIEFFLRRAEEGVECEIDIDPLTSLAWIRRERPHLLRANEDRLDS
jgi:hypothetical protein